MENCVVANSKANGVNGVSSTIGPKSGANFNMFGIVREEYGGLLGFSFLLGVFLILMLYWMGGGRE